MSLRVPEFIRKLSRKRSQGAAPAVPLTLGRVRGRLRSVVSRRSILKGGAAIGASLLASKLEYDRSNKERTAEVASMREFLSGNDLDRKVKLFGGKEYSYTDLVGTNEKPGIFCRIVTPPLSPNEVVGLLEGLGYMMHTEDAFGTKMDTNPDLEWADRFIPFLANSFGYGQVNAWTARSAILRHQKSLLDTGVMDVTDIAPLRPTLSPGEAGERMSKGTIKEGLGLDLYDERNLVSAFLVFYEAANIYGRWPKPTSKIALNRKEVVGRRLTNLCVTTYSQYETAPVVAKIQQMMNELTALGHIIEGFDIAKDAKKLLQVDGSLGGKEGKTSQMMDSVTTALSMTSLDDRIQEARNTIADRAYGWESRIMLVALQRFADELQDRWKGRIPQRGTLGAKIQRIAEGKGSTEDLRMFRMMFAGRHSLLFMVALPALRKYGNEKTADVLLEQYLKDRKGDFLNVIGDEKLFKRYFPRGDYAMYMKKMTTWNELPSDPNDPYNYSIQPKLNFDAEFQGLIPTAYLPAKHWWNDASNIMQRVLHNMEGSDGAVK